MTHREFNNRNARRNLSSFIPARNQNIRPPRTSARINLSTYVPISRQINEPVNTENSNFVSASWTELNLGSPNFSRNSSIGLDLENFLSLNQSSILQSISLREGISSSEENLSTINSTSELRKEIVLLDFYNDLTKGNLEKFSENIYIKRNEFGNFIYLISFKNNSIYTALEYDKYSYSETFKRIKPIYNIDNFISINCANRILELEEFLLQGHIHFIGTLEIINLYHTPEGSDPIFERLFDLDYEIRNLENSILYDNSN